MSRTRVRSLDPTGRDVGHGRDALQRANASVFVSGKEAGTTFSTVLTGSSELP